MDVNVFEKLNIAKFNFKDFINEYYSDEDENFKEEYSGMLKTLSSLEEAVLVKDVYVKEEYKNKGFTTQLINELKENNDTLVLYALSDSETYWMDVQGFKNLDDYVYVWNK